MMHNMLSPTLASDAQSWAVLEAVLELLFGGCFNLSSPLTDFVMGVIASTLLDSAKHSFASKTLHWW